MSGKRSSPSANRSAKDPVRANTHHSSTRTTNKSDSQPDHPHEMPTEDEVRARAFALWESAGRPECDGADFWYRAERELRGPC